MLLPILLQLLTSDPPARAADLVITHVGVVDVEHGRVIPDRDVVIRDRLIAAIESPHDRGGQGTVIDGRGKFLIPGLWDMHTHLVSFPTWAAVFLPAAVANGVLGVRDLHTRLSVALPIIREVRAGTRVGPRFVIAGEAIDGPLSKLPAATVVHTVDEARAAVRQHRADGVDFIKVYSALPKDLYLAIADEAKRIGIPFVGHVPFALTALEASEAGQKSIEHLNQVEVGTSRNELAIQAEGLAGLERGQFLIPDGDMLRATFDSARAARLFAAFRTNGTWQVPTLVVIRQISRAKDGAVPGDSLTAYAPASVKNFWNPPAETSRMTGKLLPFNQELVGRMYRAGVPILAGTDSPNPFTYAGFSLHDELALLVESGLPPAAALRAATLSAVQYLGFSDSLGTVAPGKVADLVLLGANPLEAIGNTKRIEAVIQAGKWMGRQDLDALLTTARNGGR